MNVLFKHESLCDSITKIYDVITKKNFVIIVQLRAVSSNVCHVTKEEIIMSPILRKYYLLIDYNLIMVNKIS